MCVEQLLSLLPPWDPLALSAAVVDLCSLGWISILASTAVVMATSGLVALYTFATADADLSLLLRGKHKRDAFVGKVIWVTGASQVSI